MLFTVCVKSVDTLQRPNEKKVNVDLFLKKSDSKECKTNLECRKIKCEANTTDLVWCRHGRSQMRGMYLFIIIYLFI